jgi:hypothetical protein
VLKEFYDDRMQAVDFAKWVFAALNSEYPGYEGTHFADPASWASYSSANGGFTSNALMVQEQCGVEFTPSRQELDLRISAVDQLLIRRGGFLIDPQCFMIINGFVGGYVREENPRLGDKNYKEQPIKNNFSHIHDALQYACVVEIYPKVKEPRPEIAEEDALIASFPDRMTAFSHGARNRKIVGITEEQLERTHSERARGWDPRK